MYINNINQIDELFSTILDKFYNYLLKEKKLNQICKETNFVKYQIDIVNIITVFINTSVSRIEIKEIVKNEKNIDYILNVIKSYCAFYIYLYIGYYYTGSRDLFITNILECGKNQNITSFFSSDNNSKIINYYTDIKNIIALAEYKTIDQVKILLLNNPVKYNSLIKLFNELGEDYIINHFLIQNNINSILQTFILRLIYKKEQKNELNDLLKEAEEKEGEYKYIEIVTANKNKIVDFNIIQKFVTLCDFQRNTSQEIYSYLQEHTENKDIELVIKENDEFVNFLFTNKILIPISEEFLRYHKDTEKYESDTKLKEDTKIKVIINKINTIKNFFSPLVEKNIKLKLETKKMFYKNNNNRALVLYNNDEEIKIIQKIENIDKKNENDYLIDLMDLRKYAYINFKNLARDYIRLRTNTTIEAIRYMNFKNKKPEIETRIGHDNLELNVVGVAWNPSRFKIGKTPHLKPLECFNINNLIDVSKNQKNNNGYLGFINIFNKTILNNKNSNLFYWLFDTTKDIPKNINEYNDFSTNDPQKNIKILLYQVYLNYIENVKNKFKNYIEKSKNTFNIFSLDYLFKIYQEKYFDFELNPNIKNKLLYDVLSKYIREIKVTNDENDNIIPGMRKDMIKLPIINVKKSMKNIIIVQKKEELNDNEIIEESYARCNHYRKWDSINDFSRYSKSSDEFNQMIFDFVKKYVKENDKGEYLCKSCNEGLSIKKFVSEGYYNKDSEEFMTSSIISNQKLEDLPKYSKLNRTIKNLEKNLEKISYISGLSSYLGNTPVIKLHRKTIIKDTIDLVLLHSEYLKNQPKDRVVIAGTRFGINKNLTNLFFFELKDEIFLTSSTDTDYYKKIKYNNVLAYFIFILIIELNPGQILGLKDDKLCNYFFYSKVAQSLFDGLFIRINQNDKYQIIKLPLLTYIIYYFSCLLVTNKLWLSHDNVEEKTFNINMQKSIIHTVIDLINSVTEANLLPKKNYLYELFNTRFSNKINNLFNDNILIKRILENSNKNYKVDEKTNKIINTKKIINYINIENNKEDFTWNTTREYCLNSQFKLKQYKYSKDNNTFDILNNCEDGKLHQWSVSTGVLICSLCNKKYNDLLNETKTVTESDKSLNQYYDKLKLIQIKKLTKKYCLTGEMHILANNICSLCGLNPLTYEYKEKELLSLYKKIDDNENNDFVKKINILKENQNKILETEKINHTIKNKFLKRYEKEYSINYIEDFIERLIKILGPKIKSDNKTIYLKQTLWIINHDYLGNELKKPIEFLSSDNIIQEQFNHPINNKDVYYYKDNNNKVYVYYDIVTLQYLGYSEDNKKMKTNKNITSLIKELSIRDCLYIIGLENEYYNLNHLVSEYDEDTKDAKINNNIINNMIRNRIINLKQIISNFESIINSIRNHSKNYRLYNYEENKILNEFTKKIKEFKLKDKDNHNGIFKHSLYLLKLLNMKKINNIDIQIINKRYINTKFLSKLQNTDSKLVYYLIFNLNRLLDYNSENVIESEIAHLIIKIINYVTKLYYKDYSNIDIRKFDYIITNKEAEVIDTNITTVGMYNELVNANENEEDKEKVKEANYDAQEAHDAFDVDDYEVDDDIDGTAEAFDGYEN